MQSTREGKDAAAAEFARLGHSLIALWENQPLARRLLRLARRDAGTAGRRLLAIAMHLQGHDDGELPAREDVLEAMGIMRSTPPA